MGSQRVGHDWVTKLTELTDIVVFSWEILGGWYKVFAAPLHLEMATHSSTPALKIPWNEGPGRLQSMGSQRVGHEWATLRHKFTASVLHLLLLDVIFRALLPYLPITASHLYPFTFLSLENGIMGKIPICDASQLLSQKHTKVGRHNKMIPLKEDQQMST